MEPSLDIEAGQNARRVVQAKNVLPSVTGWRSVRRASSWSAKRVWLSIFFHGIADAKTARSPHRFGRDEHLVGADHHGLNRVHVILRLPTDGPQFDAGLRIVANQCVAVKHQDLLDAVERRQARRTVARAMVAEGPFLRAGLLVIRSERHAGVLLRIDAALTTTSHRRSTRPAHPPFDDLRLVVLDDIDRPELLALCIQHKRSPFAPRVKIRPS